MSSITSTINNTVEKLSLTSRDEYATRLSKPLKKSGALEKKFKLADLTPTIGTELDGPQLHTVLDDEDIVRDLAILVAERGVVFFKNQQIDSVQQERLGIALGRLTGNPLSSGLHIHPLTREFGELGDKISVISAESNREYHIKEDVKSKLASQGWHSDITFEEIPSDYAILKITTLPKTGGDTLWASGYEVYDRLTPAFQAFLEGLTATHSAPRFIEVAKEGGFKLRDNRGSPLNVGEHLTAIHPVIRTNPVTGYKSVFVNKNFTTKVNQLNKDESDAVLDYLFTLVRDNHDLQVRYRWSLNDVAIWDNRSNLHTATNDYSGDRTGQRVVSLGEKPYFDSASTSRNKDLDVKYAGF